MTSAGRGQLSSREQQVLTSIANGRTPTQIAGDLRLSVKTVSEYRRRLLDKLEMRTTSELMRYGIWVLGAVPITEEARERACRVEVLALIDRHGLAAVMHVCAGEMRQGQSLRLVDLDPRWAADADIVIGGEPRHYADRHGMAVSFECPHCVLRERATGDKRVQRLAVWFANPIDGLPATDDAKHLWQRTGEAFETLTLTPSIDASADGHWHGFITNGHIT